MGGIREVRGMKEMKGFSLIELMIGITLSGVIVLIALPVLLTGQRVGRRAAENAAVIMDGDIIFDYLGDELRFADRIFIGDDNVFPEDWEEWYRIDKSSFSREDLEIEIGTGEEDELLLTVRIRRSGEVVYERSEVIGLLNLSLYGEGRIEGYENTAKTTKPAKSVKPSKPSKPAKSSKSPKLSESEGSAENEGDTALILWYQKEGKE